MVIVWLSWSEDTLQRHLHTILPVIVRTSLSLKPKEYTHYLLCTHFDYASDFIERGSHNLRFKLTRKCNRMFSA